MPQEKEVGHRPGVITQRIITLSDQLLEFLVNYKETSDKSFTFWLRQRDSARSRDIRLRNGMWFQGSNYIYIGFYMPTDPNNKTKTIGFVTTFDDDGNVYECFMTVAYQGIRNKQHIALYKDVCSFFDENYDQQSVDKLYIYYGTDPLKNLKAFLKHDKLEIDRMIREHQLADDFFIPETYFQSTYQNILKVKAEIQARSDKFLIRVSERETAYWLVMLDHDYYTNTESDTYHWESLKTLPKGLDRLNCQADDVLVIGQTRDGQQLIAGIANFIQHDDGSFTLKLFEKFKDGLHCDLLTKNPEFLQKAEENDLQVLQSIGPGKSQPVSSTLSETLIQFNESLHDKQYWWLNFNPKISDINNLTEGEEREFWAGDDLSQNLTGSQHFDELVNGDLLIAYETQRLRGVRAIMEVTTEKQSEQLTDDPEISAQTYYFVYKVVKVFKKPILLVDLKGKNKELSTALNLYDLEGTIRPVHPLAFYDLIRFSGEALEEASMITGEAIGYYISDYVDKSSNIRISNEAQAIASLIAFKQLKPPLAIGIFGNWGTGKSTFMTGIWQKVEAYSNAELTNYHNGIIQIDFNAWSYVDANLWASLVVKIFEEINEYLNETGKTEVDQNYNRLVRVLQVSEENRRTLENEQKKQQQAITKTQKKLHRIKEQIGEKRKFSASKLPEMLQVAVQHFWTTHQQEIQDLNLNESTTVQDLTGRIKEVGGSTGQLQQVASEMSSTKSLAFILVFLGIAGAVYGLSWVFFKQVSGASWLIAFLGPVYAFLNRLFPAMKQVEEEVNRLQSLMSQLKAVEDQEVAKWQMEKDQTELALSALYEQKQQLEQELLEIEVKESAIKKDMDFATSKEAMYTFINKRSESKDYREQLGIVHTIRQDFDLMSKIFGKETDLTEAQLKIRKDISESDKPIDRIVLYIDDLDRCPREKVVQVLEAIHLLLAFPLFVVVVGVDNRWVTTALTKHHSSFLKIEQELSKSQQEQFDKKVTVQNYLEKIFQVCYQIEEWQPVAKRQFVSELLATSIATPQAVSNTTTRNLKNIPNSAIHTDTTDVSDDDRSIKQRQNQEKNKEAERLLLVEEELEVIQMVTPLIGKTPRMIKRFVNTYQIIRSVKGIKVETNYQQDSYFAMIFLLAVSHGNQTLMCKLIDKLSEKNYATLRDLLDDCNQNSDSILDQPNADSNTLAAVLNVSGQLLKDYLPVVK